MIDRMSCESIEQIVELDLSIAMSLVSTPAPARREDRVSA